MNMKDSDSESEDEITHGGRTAVDILRAPLELPRPTRRPPTMKHPVLTAPCNTSKYKPGADFSPTFWKVVRELRLEEELGKITITELAPSPRLEGLDETSRIKSFDSDESSDGGLASGETSSSEEENNGEEDQPNQSMEDEPRCISPVKRVKSVEAPTFKMNANDSSVDFDSD